MGRYLSEELGNQQEAASFLKMRPDGLFQVVNGVKTRPKRWVDAHCACAAELFGADEEIHLAHAWALEERPVTYT